MHIRDLPQQGNLNARKHFKDLDIDGRIILKWVPKPK